MSVNAPVEHLNRGDGSELCKHTNLLALSYDICERPGKKETGVRCSGDIYIPWTHRVGPFRDKL